MGLILGISSFTTIIIYVGHEFSYDKFHSNFENIYRITTHLQRGTEDTRWAITNGGLVPLLRDKVPEVADATKAFIVQSNQTFFIDGTTHSVDERTGFYVDPNFLEILNFELLFGDYNNTLNQPNNIFLTEKMAIKYFGELNVIGRTITMKGLRKEDDELLQVMGVLKNIPQNSHIQFDYLISGSGDYWDNLEDTEKGGYPVYVYFIVHKNVDVDRLSANIDAVTAEVFPESIHFPIQKITDIYFNTNNLFEHAKTGNLSFTKSITLVAFLIIIISIINYILLSTSKSIQRAKEIGIRKINGASRPKLISQFLVEALILSLIAGFISIFVVEVVFMFAFTTWFHVSLSIFDQFYYIPFIILLSIFTGLLSGLFPAIRISKLNIINIFKGNLITSQPSSIDLRNVLVTLQFIFTIIIVISSIVILRQLNFLQNKDLGYDKDLVINIPRASNINESTWNFFKESLQSEANIKIVGTSLYEFISDYNSTSIRILDDQNPDTIALRVQWNAIDYNLIPTMDIKMIEGRNFSREYPSDSLSIIINEAAKMELGIENIINKTVLSWFFGKEPGKVIGVVNDFHHQPFNKTIIPIIFILNRTEEWEQNLLVKLSNRRYQETISLINKRWKESGI